MRPKLFCITVLLLFFTFILSAHPHVFIDYAAVPLVAEETLEAIRITWIFDPFYSASYCIDLDQDSDGKFDAEEIEYIDKNAFTHLIELDYFTRITINGKAFKLKKAIDFTTRIENDSVVYEFSLPVEKTLRKIDAVNVCCFDIGYFSSFAPMADLFSRLPAASPFTFDLVKADFETEGYGSVAVDTIQMKRAPL